MAPTLRAYIGPDAAWRRMMRWMFSGRLFHDALRLLFAPVRFPDLVIAIYYSPYNKR